MYMFCGSSSVRQFQRQFPGRFSVNVFSAATMKGLANPGAGKSNGHADMVAHLARTPGLAALYLMFGNADLEFSFYYDLVHNPGLDEQAFFMARIEALRNFLGRLLEAPAVPPVIGVLAPQLCPLQDDVVLRVTAAHTRLPQVKIAAATAAIDMSHTARLARTIRFNDALEVSLQGIAGVQLLRIDRAMLDEAGGLAAPYFSSVPRDHHANKRATFALWRPLLAPVVKPYALLQPA